MSDNPARAMRIAIDARKLHAVWFQVDADDARARLSANATLNTLESAVLASFGAPAATEAKP